MSQKQKKNIYLISAKNQNYRHFFNPSEEKREIYWIYLGKNISKFLEIEKKIGKTIINIKIGDILQHNSKKHRQEYIDFIGRYAQETDALNWYLTSLSEKNPYNSDFYLNFCYMKTIFRILDSMNGTFLIFCESRFLMKTLWKNLRKNPSIMIRCIDSGAYQEKIISPFVRLKNKSWFLLRFFFRISVAKIFSHLKKNDALPPLDKPMVVIHSWADKRSFPARKSYEDAYFGDLGERLNRNGKGFCYLINVLPTFFYLKAVFYLRDINTPWVLFEEYLDFSDIYRALTKSPYQEMTHKERILSGLIISDLILEEFSRDRNGTRCEQSYLCYLAAKKMSRILDISSFIYTFENHIWEKMFIYGFRTISPSKKLVGYAHATVNPMELSYSCSVHEKTIMPLPDLILVNGVRARDTLVESGFDRQSIIVLGSLRYAYLFTNEKMQKTLKTNEILVVLSADYHKSIEMIIKCLAAFRNSVEEKIIFKPHPILNTTSIIRFFPALPKHFSFATGSIRKLFSTIDLVIYNDSSAAVEAAALGIPLLHIKSDFTIDINIFDNELCVPSLSNPQDIFKQSKISIEEKISLPSSETIKQFFLPPDNDNILINLL
jgi:hypothetical protein